MHKPKHQQSKNKIFVANPFRWDDDDIMEPPIFEVKSAPVRKKKPQTAQSESIKLPQISRNFDREDMKNRITEEVRKKQWIRLGGLGPNIGNDEWQHGKTKMDMIHQYSKQVRQEHPPKTAMHSPPKQPQKSSRQIGIEYSLMVPRPRIQLKHQRLPSYEPEHYIVRTPATELEQYESKHRYLSRVVSKL